MIDLQITRTARYKLFQYPKLVQGEIGGLGLAKLKDNAVVIYDVLLFEQEVSGAHTELELSSVAKLMEEMLLANRPVEDLKLWWHSHAGMSCFWSGTDTGTVEQLGRTAPWMVSIVVNKAGEYRARLDIHRPMRLAFDDLKIADVEDANDTLLASMKAEVESKVREERRWMPSEREFLWRPEEDGNGSEAFAGEDSAQRLSELDQRIIEVEGEVERPKEEERPRRRWAADYLNFRRWRG